MAIENNNFKFVMGARLDSEFCREESMSSEEENDIQKLADAESDDDNNGDEYEDYDSGAGSDDFDLLELSETNEEFCQIGDQTCCIPFELYDLEGLGDILSMDVWNNVLTDDERFGLANYLPDMDQETFMRTMKELFTCCNFHFVVPTNKLFDMLKGGLCEPRVALYRQGLGFFQKRYHYHVVSKHQNTMVNNLVHMKEVWMKCRGYGIEEKLRVLNIMKSEKRLMCENLEEQETTSSSDWEDYGNGFQSTKRQNGYKKQKWVRYPGFRSRPTFDVLPRGKQLSLEPANHRKENSKGSLEVSKINSGPYGVGKKFKYPDKNQEISPEDPMIYRKFRGAKLSKRDGRLDMNDRAEPFVSQRQPGLPYNHIDWKLNSKNGLKMLSKDEETESDSSEQFSKSDDDDPLIRSKWLYPSSGADFRKAKFRMKDKKSVRDLDGFPETSGKNHGSGGMLLHEKEEEGYSVKAKRKVKTSGSGRLNGSNVRGFEDFYILGPRKLNTGGHMEEIYNVLGEQCETFQVPKTYSAEKKHFRLITPETPVTETTMEDACLENKSQKKPFTLITPTVHTGFSFSIIHLLSAVRMAMITFLPEVSLDLRKHHHMNDDSQTNAPYLTVQEIVNRVKSNPGDPCILKTQEPLHELVRGVLKIISSRSSPLGAKGWKPLAVYDRSIKSWSWVGPISQSSSDHEAIEEVTSPDSWGLSYKILVKLVDSFANWLKSGQQTLQQIGSLPAPPLTLMQVNLDEKERFRDLKAQRSLNTITQSSDEVKDYFHKEEILRYSIPNRAFAYTALDGKKSTVAPSKKGAGKPTSKARDHFMLKRDRPPHVTILCLVRDAAARLPGSIGTRADVCTLIRDSQYIVEDVSDAQVNQVVSGALDRLHYERDPCVHFDGERKLWVYLHREREEEDFEDDVTSSTKKWKRQKKESTESSDLDVVTLAYHGTGEQTGLDFSSDLNLALSGVDNKQTFVG